MVFLIIVIYNLLFFLAIPVYLVKYSLRKRLNKDLWRRFSFYDKKTLAQFSKLDKPIWIHAVSVGEVVLLKDFIPFLRQKYKNSQIVLSVITPAGYEIACKMFSDKVESIFYLPLDLSLFTSRIVKLVNPYIFISMETEIWPSLYYNLNRRKVDIYIVNARISDDSFKRYRGVRFFMKKILSLVKKIACVDETALDRFLALGVDKQKVLIMGNLKFISLSFSQEYLDAFKEKWSRIFLRRDQKIILAASTHEPEERIMLDVYSQLNKSFTNLKLLICPRHIERTESIMTLSKNLGFDPVRLSQYQDQETDVYILDTVGELFYFYSLADIVFMGGSMVSKGGHNILEPSFFAKPVVFGKFMYNFESIKNEFLDLNAAIMVNDRLELKQILISLLKNDYTCRELGNRAFSAVITKQKFIRENLNNIFDE